MYQENIIISKCLFKTISLGDRVEFFDKNKKIQKKEKQRKEERKKWAYISKKDWSIDVQD